MNPRLIHKTDVEWPERLDEFDPTGPPKELHVCGRVLPPVGNTIAIVGSRQPTVAGVEAAQRLAIGLVEAGFAIVSGLAVGIDTVAHRGALQAGGHTVAVLGCGLDIDYPERNARLKGQIASVGTLVSEYPLGTAPKAGHFPLRNRIIAGLATGVIFVEGGHKSGGKITARYALDANRHVFAVPGSCTNPMAAGPNELIRTSQAALVTDIEHVLQELAPQLAWRDSDRSLEGGGTHAGPHLDETSLRILMFLSEKPVPADRICMDLGFKRGEVSLALANLEVRGFINRRLMGYEISTGGIRARSAVANIS